MADEVWKIREDGYLDLEVDCNRITYHPNLNIVLVLSKFSEVLIIDVNSGLLLQRTFLSANHNGQLQATYLTGLDKILFIDEHGVGVRANYNGVLLLDTILQTPISRPDDVVRLELLVSEAVVLQQTLVSMDLPGVEHRSEVVTALTTQIALANTRPKKGTKAHKWNTICLELPHCYLKWVCSGLVSELKRQNRHIPALAIASAVNERLNSLLPTNAEGQQVDRTLMFSEAMRRQTFSKWPHMNYKWALPDQMAQAGFYHQPNSAGDDRAMCFTCTVCLVCWEPTDEPWSEHERHSPSCPFVKGEYTQNVPLSVSYATAPAVHTDQPMEILGTSSVQELIPTASPNGSVIIWNCSRQLKIEVKIAVMGKPSIYSDIMRKKEAWADQEVVEIPLSDPSMESEVRVGAVSVVGGPSEVDYVRPALIAGISRGKQTAVSPRVRAMNNMNSGLAVDIMKVAESKPAERQLYLVVYDFHYRYQSNMINGNREVDNNTKTLLSGTGTSASRQENSNLYPEIFLSKFLYTSPVLHDVDSADVVYQTQDILVGDNFTAPSSSSGISCPVPLGVAVPTAGGGTFDTSMAINEGLEVFPSTSNGSSQLVPKIVERDSKSDAISDLSSVENSNGVLDTSSFLAQEPVPIQSVIVDTFNHDLYVSELHPTKDGQHLLVVLRSVNSVTSGMLLLYKLILSEPSVMLVETPVCVKVLQTEVVSLTLLPLEGESTANPLGVAAVVTHSGQLMLIDIATLDIKACATHKENIQFVSVTYCNSLERVCAASEKGSLHFFTLHDEDLVRSEENTFENLESNFYSPKQSPKDFPLLVNASELDLSALYELTKFENLVPCFAATLPACWAELMQAQKQRRHPQHLQHADDVHHTRSWRLQHDLTSWDEHIFELTLPRSVCVGHVDLKFSLHAQCQSPPNIQFTLLKQNASGIGKLSDNSTDVDAGVDFIIPTESGHKKGVSVNPVTTEQFARAHNTEILCGPVSLASCLDLSDQGGTVTFTSPKLFKFRGRTLLVHIKNLASGTSAIGQDGDKKSRYGPGGAFWEYNGLVLTPGSTVDRLASSVSNQKKEHVGCDWLHEISITIRKTKQIDIPNERLERCAMLESDVLVEHLLSLVTGEGSNVHQNMALDILVWLAAIRLSRLRPVPSHQVAMINIIQQHLPHLITSCFIRGDRTIARKCVKLIILCSDGMRNADESVSGQFDSCLVRILLETLPTVPQCWSAAAMRWYFSLLTRMVTVDSIASVAHKALGMLTKVASHLHARQNPSHLLLHTRFGLCGTPFEPELFDQEPPAPAKFSPTPLIYTMGGTNFVWANDVVNAPSGPPPVNSSTPLPPPGADDLRDLLNIKAKCTGEGRSSTSHSQLRSLTANHHMKGLLEVQPLHFTCHATSDGTKLEKMDSGEAGNKVISEAIVNYFEAPPISPISPPVVSNHVDSNGPKKVTENNLERLPWQQLVMAPPQHMLVVERMHSGARRFVVLDLGSPVLLTDLYVPACPDLLSLSIDLWTVGEDTDARRLVVAPDITTKTLIMNDITPPPVVRFIKITTIGRYGMNTTKCKIPIGCFYGHLIVLPGDDYAEKNNQVPQSTNIQNQLSVLSALFEDIQCRYSLACSKLQDLLSPLLTAEIANVSHMHHYLRRGSELLKPSTSKITTAYQECITYQHQLNSVRSVMRRLGSSSEPPDPNNALTTACTDKLRVLGENLLDLLLFLVYDAVCMPKSVCGRLDQSMCEQLFHWLCVGEETRTQLATCTLLVRICGLQPWWGDFLVSTLTNLYSSNQVNIFPQDRVFILLVYLGRKSLCGGASRSTVIDSVLKTLLMQLTPLALTNLSPGFLQSNMDLPLISWLLLFLSQCLDSTPNSSEETQDKSKTDKEMSAGRWDFLQGELSMQRRMSVVGHCTAGRGYRRKLQKKLMHHKQQLEDLEVAKKAFQASTQVSGLPHGLKTKALSALSTQAAKLSYKLENALKQQEQFLKKSVKQQASTSKMKESVSESRRSKDDAGSSSGSKHVASENNVPLLPRAHCLPVARALTALLLHMDYTCNLDTFLLTCKVLARVTLWTRPSLTIGEVISEDQLSGLVRLAVNSSQHSTPWVCHAITCLLQDMLQGGNGNKTISPEPSSVEEEPEHESVREEEAQASSNMSEMDDDFVPMPESDDSAASPGMPSIKIKINSNFPLPSLLESDDSELEDLLDDILERGRNLTKKTPAARVPLGIATNVSTSLDSRLEYGVDTNAEVTVRRMTIHGAYTLPMSVNAPIAGPQTVSMAVGSSSPSRWEEPLTAPWQQPQPACDQPSSVDMLRNCFDGIFLDLLNKDKDTSNLELVLQLWLTLNLDNPLIRGDSRALMLPSYLYLLSVHQSTGSTAKRRPSKVSEDAGERGASATSCANEPASPGAWTSCCSWHVGSISECWCLAFQTLSLISNLPSDHTDNNLNNTLQRMASVIVTNVNFPKLLLAFLSSSQIKGCAGVSVCQSLHEMLVRLEMRCDVVSSGSELGCQFKLLLLRVFDQLVRPSGAIALQQGPLDAQAKLVQLMLHLDFTNTDVNTAASILNAVSVLVHSYMMSGENIRWRSMMENGLNLSGLLTSGATVASAGTSNNSRQRPASWDLLIIGVIRLVTNLLHVPLEAPQPSQTDEHKAANTRPPCVADMVVQDDSTMNCLLSSLGMSSPAAIADSLEPSSVGQAVFQLLSTLARKVTSPKFILKPVVSYIARHNSGLSEGLLSLVLRVLDGAEALQEWLSLGAVEVVCDNLVRTSDGPSTVSVVMQHLSLPLPLPPHNKKTADIASGLLNFAPFGCISSSNPTAQPADVLIQSTPPHRRARAPAWSYHFYPDESWVEVTITLPCAVLLREVHLQPHLTSLATCPSAVAVEVSPDGRSPLVPVSLPLDSSGLTFIRLQLPQPEVVTTVLLRLYKPRDSSNIGLSQIRLLGNTTFNDPTASDDTDQTTVSYKSNSSMVWIRLLHHCMTVCGECALQTAVISSAVKVGPALLQACCGLLQAPTPALEHVLYTLGTHQPDLGLQTINILLNTHTSQGGLSGGVNSVVELLYLLCTTRDSHTQERVQAVLSWLLSIASQSRPASATYIQCVAAILWANPDLAHLVTDQLFSAVYEWTMSLEARSALKRGVDILLCSMCYIKPVLFPTLLQRMGVLVPIRSTSHAASITDDRKDGESQEQDMSEWYDQLVLQDLQHLQLSESQLMTVAVACQSPPATLQLLDSGLPNLLTNTILEFSTRKHSERRCSKQSNQSRLTDSDKASGRNHVIKEGNRPMVQLEMVSSILRFFAEVCSEGNMRDWLGSSEGSVFWLPLLTLLCTRTATNSRCEMMSESFNTLETATVKFLSRCCWCHPTNQKLLAVVLCNVISQQRTQGEMGISGVTRRLVLQLLLESEKIEVCVRGVGVRGGTVPTGPTHPRYGVGHNNHLLYLSVHTTVADIIKLVSHCGAAGNVNKAQEPLVSNDSLRETLWSEVSEQLFVAAGVTAKDKRIKDAKNVIATIFKDKVSSQSNKKGQSSCATLTDLACGEGLQHSELSNVILPGALTLSQLLTVLDQRTVSLSSPCMDLTLVQLSTKEGSDMGELLLSTEPFPSALQVFTQQGGLALLAEHLPLVYPETLMYFRTATTHQPTHQPSHQPTTADQIDADWVKVEASDDIYEDVEESMVAPYMSSQGGKHNEASIPTVPLHSLAAFGLFLRLPGYAEVLLRDKRKAQCLLRLVLGVSDDGEGGDIMSNPVSSSLPTLPFEVLRQLLESTPLSTDDGVLLRRTALDQGALHLLLSCLAVFTHQPHESVLPGLTSLLKTLPQTRNKSDDKSHLYWAKGTGFGTGSTTQSWNVEQALSRQRSEEQHVTVLLQVLSTYINPGGVVNADRDSSDDDSDTPTKPVPQPLPPCIHDLLQQSCLLPALSSYLRNDSVLDMARHIPLYRSVLQLLRAIAQNAQLVPLLLPRPKQNSLQLSTVCLLQKMKIVVDTYASRLKINKPKNQKKLTRVTNSLKSQLNSTETAESDEGLALLIPDIQETANLVQAATDKLIYESESDSESGLGHDLELPVQKTLEQRYLEVMKPMQFETYEMISESSDGNGFQFVVSYHFESNVRAGGDRSHPARVKRLAQETVTLSTSLPLSFSSSVFVRCDTDRLDIMKVLITGPAETPYANGCFELDVYFPPDYPNSPMLINLETTGHHTIRFNPNLYNDGKVCLSVLNTWHGRPEEKWNAHTSSFLQVLVSIQSLILVPEPYFNEPGYERSRGTQAGNQSSREYNSNICQATVKWAMLEQLRNPSPCFKQVIQTHFWMKRKEIKKQIEGWISDMESQAADRRTGRTISLNTMALKRHYQQLCEELAKLKPPLGMEDLADVDEPTWQQDMEKLVSQVCE
ncbi:baculoviral IAP repeat-containing protein 6 [Macrosteles quadrilineatus]|uniref:baculoviral IAP repeat-containing protein 6 n=1 Tax=Macrosteles quadrilineatus TaxID=74068 RepID=UPI0023E22909|nr:baculoviral IAP repeat-containing protein 6 [Macrosteles quadrilineatus]